MLVNTLGPLGSLGHGAVHYDAPWDGTLTLIKCSCQTFLTVNLSHYVAFFKVARLYWQQHEYFSSRTQELVFLCYWQTSMNVSLSDFKTSHTLVPLSLNDGALLSSCSYHLYAGDFFLQDILSLFMPRVGPVTVQNNATSYSLTVILGPRMPFSVRCGLTCGCLTMLPFILVQGVLMTANDF